jgi:hypothetical protein
MMEIMNLFRKKKEVPLWAIISIHRWCTNEESRRYLPTVHFPDDKKTLPRLTSR